MFEIKKVNGVYVWTVDVSIYILVDPNGVVFYVGRTSQPLKKRMKQHLAEATFIPNHPKSKYIEAIDRKLTIKAVYTKRVKDEVGWKAHKQLALEEADYIQKYISLGCPLTNRRLYSK